MQIHHAIRHACPLIQGWADSFVFSAARPDRVAELYDDEAARTEICCPRQSVPATRQPTPFAPADNDDDNNNNNDYDDNDDEDDLCHRIRVATWSSGQTLDVQHTRGGLHAHAWC